MDIDNRTGIHSLFLQFLMLNIRTFESVLSLLAKHSPYNYVPSHAAAIVFLSFYGLLTRQSSLTVHVPIGFGLILSSPVLHLGQATRYRMWWLLPMACLCGLIEALG